MVGCGNQAVGKQVALSLGSMSTFSTVGAWPSLHHSAVLASQCISSTYRGIPGVVATTVAVARRGEARA